MNDPSQIESLSLQQQCSGQERAVLLLEYYGPGFSGSQLQSNSFTVQQALQGALAKLKVPHGEICFAGRTDAGVHAKGQVVHFDIEQGALRHIPDLRLALNAMLPETACVTDTAITPLSREGFHATISARWRWYQYRLFVSPRRTIWKRPDATWIRTPVSVELMQEAANHYLGEHDFTSFKCPQTDIKNGVCRVIQSRISQEGDEIVFDIIANRFVYRMVRILVGTLLDIGMGNRLIPEDIPRILQQKNRVAAGRTAPPEGLSLMAVQYDAPWDFFHENLYVKTLRQRIQESSREQNILRKAS